MTFPKKLTVSGALRIGPIQPTVAPFPSRDCVVSLNTEQTTQADVSNDRSFNSPVTFVDLLTGTGITNIRALHLRARGGTFEIRYTADNSGSPIVDQVTTLSDELLITNPSSGSQWTALAVRGVGDLEVTIAGD